MRIGVQGGHRLWRILVFLVCFYSVNSHSLKLPPLVRSDIPTLDQEVASGIADVRPFADEDLNYRLPNDTIPIHYDISLTTNVHIGDREFTGTVAITLEVIQATTDIVIHARQLKGFEATIVDESQAGSAIPAPVSCHYELAREFLTCTRDDGAQLPEGTKWILTIKYKGELRDDNAGFYISKYRDENGERSLATTQFESTDARHAFPCYDEPMKRATFTVTIEHDPIYHAISNMPIDEARSQPGKTVFQKTLNMPTYILAFIVSDFKYTEGQLNNLPQRLYSRPGTQHEQEWALLSGMLILQRLVEYYDVEYPLPKEDQVAVPDFAAGAMENWGLVTYREEYLLYNKETSTINTQTSIATTVAHEYVHQWFGDLVAIEWWGQLWLKESFAQLFAWVSTDHAYPEWGCFQQFHTDDYNRALNNDASNTPRPLTNYVARPEEIARMYDAISYAKGASVLDMWRHALTEKVFRRGLHNYLDANKYGNGNEAKLFQALQIAAKEEDFKIVATIQEMLSTWTRQGGYPVLTVTRNYNDQSFNVSQQAFFNDETHTDESKSWYVPINYAVQSNPDFRDTIAADYLEKEKQITINSTKISNDDWLILNKQSTGYYRINYDKRNWGLITDGLLEKHYKIHVRNRAQLMQDAYRFSTTQRLSHDILLNLMTYLRSEDQYAPWNTANSIIVTFNRYLSSDKDYSKFQAYVEELVRGPYEKFGINDIPGEQHYQKFTRNVLINLACLAGIKSCLQETNTKLNDFIKHGIPIEPNLQAQTYCNGLRQTGDEEFNFVLDRLMNSVNQAERRLLISSLGCASKAEHAQKFIQSSIDKTNTLRTQERTTILSSVYSRSETGLLECIDFLQKNWLAYAQLTVGTFGGGQPLNDDIVGMSQYVVNNNQEQKLLVLVETVKNTEHVGPNLEANVKTNIAENYDWLKQNREPLMKWVTNYLNGVKGSAHRTVQASILVLLIASFVHILRLF